MRKLWVWTGVLVILVVVGVAAGTATAAAPRVEPFSGSFTDTTTCPGVTIQVSVVGRDIILSETDTAVFLHEDAVFTLSANGKTVTDNDHFTVRLDFANGVFRYAGAVFNIQAPGVGKLLMDTGIIIFDANGNVIHQGGPHPGYYGDVQSLCTYLADP